MRFVRFLFTKAQAARHHAVWLVYCRPDKGLVGSCDPQGDPDIERSLGLDVVCRWCKRPI